MAIASRPDSVLALTGFPPTVKNVPANWPTRPTPDKLSLLFNDGLSNDGVGDYWVHWTDYCNYALVGGSTDKYFWILSRKETIDKSDIPYLTKLVEKYGYDPCKVKIEMDAGIICN